MKDVPWKSLPYNKEQFSQQNCFPTENFFCLQPDLNEIWHEGDMPVRRMGFGGVQIWLWGGGGYEERLAANFNGCFKTGCMAQAAEAIRDPS